MRGAFAGVDSEVAPQRFLTADLPGVGGLLRESDDDFDVDEVPARAPSGRGDFAHARFEKRGISTPELLRRIGAALRVPVTRLGAAGFKDARAVARQWISLPWELEPRLCAATIKDADLLEVARDERPLHPGDLAGNRFRVRVRGVAEPDRALARAQTILDVLARRGVPNFFGAQRFGVRGEAAEIGRRLLLGENVAALDLILGAPSQSEGDPRARAFREAYERGDFRGAREFVPGRLPTEARLLDLLARGRSKPAVAGTLAPAMRRFALSAWQSLLFNRVLARRLHELDVAWSGDLLVDEATGEVHECRDPELDQPRVTEKLLHPTAPLIGDHVERAGGRMGELEREVLAESEVPPACLRRPTGLALHGERRAVRFLPVDLESKLMADEPSLELEFRLPRGCFATALLAEVTKSFAMPR